ncbi:MAG: chemotaxis protein CheW [Desulfurivibrionaceae bacterium]
MSGDTSSQGQGYGNTSEYLVFSSAEHKFALQQEVLVSIIDMPNHTLIPNMPSHMRGCIDYMGKAVPAYDIRKKNGYATLREEIDTLIDSLAQRKQDHLAWLEKLKDQVEHGLEITVQTDPHKCAFGLWYDTCKFHSFNLTDYMALFDAPHKRIHSLAIEVSILIQAGKPEAAKEVIHHAENNELQSLIALFDGAARKIKQFTYEYAVIFERADDQSVAILADNIEYFGLLDEVISPLPIAFSQQHGNFIDALGRRSKGDETEEILILNIDKFLLDDPG